MKLEFRYYSALPFKVKLSRDWKNWSPLEKVPLRKSSTYPEFFWLNLVLKYQRETVHLTKIQLIRLVSFNNSILYWLKMTQKYPGKKKLLFGPVSERILIMFYGIQSTHFFYIFFFRLETTSQKNYFKKRKTFRLFWWYLSSEKSN